MDTHQTLNNEMIQLFRDIVNLEEHAIVMTKYQDITNNDMRVIQAIGIQERKNMSSIAKELSVTVGTLTIAMNSLVKKGYVVRERGVEDRRVVYIALSDKGRIAYARHEQFHQDMMEDALRNLSMEERECLSGALKKLNHWFDEFQKN